MHLFLIDSDCVKILFGAFEENAFLHLFLLQKISIQPDALGFSDILLRPNTNYWKGSLVSLYQNSLGFIHTEQPPGLLATLYCSLQQIVSHKLSFGEVD